MDSISAAMDKWTKINSHVDVDAMETTLRLTHLLRAIENEVTVIHEQAQLAPGDFDVLATILRQEDVTPGQLSQTLLLSKAGITGRLHKLKKQGLIEEKINLSDKRGKTLTLTPEGHDRIMSTVEAHAAAERKAFNHLSSRQQGELLELLRSWSKESST
ncbi:MarR family winged helix-turn-helix transcriptional regulator [Corynebacterium sp. p3-SID1194]|uniref:MarR family winged helix-turn-helix transcriptional regulator n=1 Tax=Corynebacterium sp. p3-SID1194 TaxID=2916105 RepID=UPI0021A3A836|nr:MarR family winged helix-turn-helix transcriptional regulator [Corynebacterium sp. p3-SID1194]MCT1449409.1 MarR family winged helix-turn-helix transcriptional regulator [Corynebacterium sp. p3-SID1194]